MFFLSKYHKNEDIKTRSKENKLSILKVLASEIYISFYIVTIPLTTILTLEMHKCKKIRNSFLLQEIQFKFEADLLQIIFLINSFI